MSKHVHLRDYVYMEPPDGGAPEKVPSDSMEITRKMVAGWKQCDPPKEDAATETKSKGDK